MKGKAGTAGERKQIILTHDIDIFPRYALELARLENRYNIRTTYYVLLHSEWYNALSPENMAIWQEIKELGHDLALHYDGRYDKNLNMIASALATTLDAPIYDVSQHLIGILPVQPTAGLTDRSTIEGYQYIADSGGWWRNGCICQHLDKKLLVVTHPIWWLKGQNPFDEAARDAYQVIDRASTYWKKMVNEHRSQKVQVSTRSA